MDKIDSIVIGGGISGLSAAYAAVRRGESVRIIEPDHFGGMIRSDLVDGFTIERGPNVFLERPEIRSLINDLELDRIIVKPIDPKYRQYLWNGTRVVNVPRGPLGFLGSELLSAREKITLFLSSGRKGVLTPRKEDESVLEFLGRLAGERPIRECLDIILKGIHGGEVERLSARMLFPNLWKHALGGGTLRSFFSARRARHGGVPSIFVLRGGNETLAKRLTDSFHPSAIIRDSVRSVRPGSGPEAPWQVELASGSSLSSSRVVVSLAGEQNARVIEGFEPELAARVRTLEYATLIVVHLAIPSTEKLPDRGFGVLFPRGMEERFLGVMTNSLVFPHVAPAGKHLLTVCLGGTAAEYLCQNSDDVLFSSAEFGLRKYLGIKNFSRLAVTRWPRAVPQLVVGRAEVANALRECEDRHPGLTFVGVDKGGVGVSERVRIGSENP